MFDRHLIEVRLGAGNVVRVVLLEDVAHQWLRLRLLCGVAELEETAASLGSSPTRVFITVTVPLIRPAVLAGVTLSWARALGEFGATIAFAGDSPGRTRTLPLALYRALETDPDQALVMGVVLVAVALSVLVGLRSRWLTVR